MARKSKQRDSNVTGNAKFRYFLGPKYWVTWLGIGGIYVAALIPLFLRVPLAKAFSTALFFFAKSRRHVAETNIRLCFPDLPPKKQRILVRRVFLSTTLSLFETAHAWCFPNNKPKVTFEGLEHVEAAKETGKGILLTGGHFAPLDMGGVLVENLLAFHTVYRKHDNALFNYFMTHARERYSAATVARKDIKGMLRVLQQGKVLWYAPDQDYGRKASIFIPFFGIETATITMTSKLAKAGKATVLPIWVSRTADYRGFHVKFFAPHPIPSGDDVEDAKHYTKWLETQILKFPDQYLWLHKRFKTRPKGEKSLYK